MRGQIVTGAEGSLKIWVKSDTGSLGHQLNGRGLLPDADLWLKVCPRARRDLSESTPVCDVKS